MRLDQARAAWDRADRMLAALRPHSERFDEQAFQDRLPYVLDLLAAVGRQIHDAIPKGGPADAWWKTQRSGDVDAITELRHAELKWGQTRSARHVVMQTNAPAGTFHGHIVNAGDSLTSVTWTFVGGRFDGMKVMQVLDAQLARRKLLIEDAETHLS